MKIKTLASVIVFSVLLATISFGLIATGRSLQKQGGGMGYYYGAIVFSIFVGMFVVVMLITRPAMDNIYGKIATAFNAKYTGFFVLWPKIVCKYKGRKIEMRGMRAPGLFGPDPQIYIATSKTAEGSLLSAGVTNYVGAQTLEPLELDGKRFGTYKYGNKMIASVPRPSSPFKNIGRFFNSAKVVEDTKTRVDKMVAMV